jgi:hypothetical protein
VQRTVTTFVTTSKIAVRCTPATRGAGFATPDSRGSTNIRGAMHLNLSQKIRDDSYSHALLSNTKAQTRVKMKEILDKGKWFLRKLLN